MSVCEAHFYFNAKAARQSPIRVLAFISAHWGNPARTTIESFSAKRRWALLRRVSDTPPQKLLFRSIVVSWAIPKKESSLNVGGFFRRDVMVSRLALAAF